MGTGTGRAQRSARRIGARGHATIAQEDVASGRRVPHATQARKMSMRQGNGSDMGLGIVAQEEQGRGSARWYRRLRTAHSKIG